MTITFNRNRRIRINPSIRKMVAETTIRPEQLVKPVFIHLGKDPIPLPKLPDSEVLSLTNGLLSYIEKLMKLGILGVNLYPVVAPNKKDTLGTEAVNPKGIIPEAIKLIKKHFPECVVMPDIALDPYTSHGHDGVINDKGEVLNDESINILAKQSVLLAEAGADLVAPSDMFDGRTLTIRQALDHAGFPYVGILAYAAKFASSYYGPFRSALGNDHLKGIDKRAYQIEPANGRQALAEIRTDIEEAADIIMIKPAGHYLDIVAKTRALTEKPIAVFQISGECAMIKLAAENGLLDEKQAVREQFLSMRRAGADIIFTYYAEKLFAD